MNAPDARSREVFHPLWGKRGESVLHIADYDPDFGVQYNSSSACYEDVILKVRKSLIQNRIAIVRHVIPPEVVRIAMHGDENDPRQPRSCKEVPSCASGADGNDPRSKKEVPSCASGADGNDPPRSCKEVPSCASGSDDEDENRSGDDEGQFENGISQLENLLSRVDVQQRRDVLAVLEHENLTRLLHDVMKGMTEEDLFHGKGSCQQGEIDGEEEDPCAADGACSSSSSVEDLLLPPKGRRQIKTAFAPSTLETISSTSSRCKAPTTSSTSSSPSTTASILETTEYKWLRSVKPELYTGLHRDRYYLGNPRYLTAWIPFSESVDLGNGTLVWLASSSKDDLHDCSVEGGSGPCSCASGSTKNTCKSVEVPSSAIESSCSASSSSGEQGTKAAFSSSSAGGNAGSSSNGTTSGWLTLDASEFQVPNGFFWRSTEFGGGDVAIFCMDLLHMTIPNLSQSNRISCDTRWRLRVRSKTSQISCRRTRRWRRRNRSGNKRFQTNIFDEASRLNNNNVLKHRTKNFMLKEARARIRRIEHKNGNRARYLKEHAHNGNRYRSKHHAPISRQILVPLHPGEPRLKWKEVYRTTSTME
ncbi:unnamed protein product [Amoebophrya sp. A25]|nr:unnamed protein product [Amoebophrya sp. A25]|eukprot:GSA25T00019495001.1